MKEWECVQVKNHRDVNDTIAKFQKNGWILHTYSTSGHELGQVTHYLLFEKGE